MPPTRKAHHKSRKGCVQCKQRHVKCNEVRPRCGSCVKRDALCSFITAEPSPSNEDDIPEPSNALNNQPTILSRSQEMDLIHHFVTVTIKTICHDPKDWHMWEFGIPRLAFRYEFLLDTILAASALHRGYLEPENEAQWTRSAIEYQGRGLAAFNKALDTLEGDVCQGAFAFNELDIVHSGLNLITHDNLKDSADHLSPSSIVTAVVEMAMPQPKDDPIEQIVALYDYVRGAASLALGMQDVLQHGELGSMYMPPTIKWEYDPELRESFEQRLAGLYTLVAGDPEETVYRGAISLMLKLFHESPYSMMMFSLFVGPDFIQLICQRKPLAILIYLYTGVVFNLVNEWWGRDIGKRIVNNLTLPLDVLDLNPALVSALHWAQQQVRMPPDPDKIYFWRIFDADKSSLEDIRYLHPAGSPMRNLCSAAESAVVTPEPARLGNENSIE